MRIIADWTANMLDFRAVTFVGGNIVIDADGGDDTIYGTDGAEKIYAGYGKDVVNAGGGDDAIVAGGGNDTVDGGEGSDTYLVSGNKAGGWSSFQDYDTYKDSGLAGTDTIKAVGIGNVDIGLAKFDASNGIDAIDGTGATGNVRLLGGWASDSFDFSKVTFAGNNITIDTDGGNDTVVGSAGNDKIYARSGNDTVNGGAGSDLIAGGEGKDTLAGGLDADHFRFDTALSKANNVDTITDFEAGVDHLDLAAAIFGKLGAPGTLAADKFVVGAKAVDANDHIIYNATTGVLSYDADGNGAGAQVAFAQLSAGLALTHNDFLIV
ncbi:MAG: calcium-binding protein [Bauldia sp.]|nr:MAG: calcium-binding protein [Bauldia sp.]